MSDIQVTTIGDTLVVDSRLIAKELGIEHKAFLRTIRKYLVEFEESGILSFENAKPVESSLGGRPETFCYLNEEQAIYAMTLSRNTEKVRQCKRNLAKAFLKAKETIEKSKGGTTPNTFSEALYLAARLQEEKERLESEKLALKGENELLSIENGCLTEENEALSEAVDELFEYSSVIRIAKFNNVSEKLFKWQTLKAASIRLGLEVKKVPCPRFEYKNLYSHDAWRAAYPNVKLPETLTLVLRRE
jgi:phage regulator Rha-like protein